MTKQDSKQDRPAVPATRPEAVTAKVADAYASARDRAASVAHGAASGIEGNPLAAILSGIALGAAAGALLPRSDREKALLAPLGERLAEAVRAAIAAGRSAGLEALDGSGLSIDSLREQVARLVSQAGQAAGTAGLAAFNAAKDGVRK